MTMNNLIEMEMRVKELILHILTEPLNKVMMNHEIIQKYTKSQRRTVRWVEELEYIVQKY